MQIRRHQSPHRRGGCCQCIASNPAPPHAAVKHDLAARARHKRYDLVDPVLSVSHDRTDDSVWVAVDDDIGTSSISEEGGSRRSGGHCNYARSSFYDPSDRTSPVRLGYAITHLFPILTRVRGGQTNRRAVDRAQRPSAQGYEVKY